jgi:hypothetical protein
MDGTPNNIIDQQCYATHPQRLSGESLELVWSEVVHEEIATHEIKGTVSEGQSERIASHCAIAAVEVSAGAVQKSDCQIKLRRQALLDFGGNKAGSGGDFQKRSALTATFRQRSADEFLGCPDAAEPLVEHLQIAERAGDFALSSCVRVQ